MTMFHTAVVVDAGDAISHGIYCMKTLSAEEVLSLTDVSTVEEFLVKKDLLNKKMFNAHDSYEIPPHKSLDEQRPPVHHDEQHKDAVAEKLMKDYKLFKLGLFFLKKNDKEKRGGRQDYINDAMKRFCEYAWK